MLSIPAAARFLFDRWFQFKLFAIRKIDLGHNGIRADNANNPAPRRARSIFLH
jgi:hypothetical protein